MLRKTGIHFYINITNLDDVAEHEENQTGEVRHTIHALDTFFTSIEAYGKKHYHEAFVVEKITGSRLHMYVVSESIPDSFEIVSAVSQYAYRLTTYLHDDVAKYKTLLPFHIHVGACYGDFYEFEFKREQADEMTTIGYAANFAAKLQILAEPLHILMSENIFDSLVPEQRSTFKRIEPQAIKKYDQKYCYDSEIRHLFVKFNFSKDLERAGQIAQSVNLQSMNFRDVAQPVSYRNLSKTECRKLNGVPLFADIRGFTKQFDAEDANLEEMAAKTQKILTSMYDTVERCHGIHVQFQGDRELAVFHDYSTYNCTSDAVIAGLRLIDTVKDYHVCIGVGQSYGRLFAAKIGARGEKDNILLGRTVIAADRNEDELAKENQLVISSDIYKQLTSENSDLASLFKRIDNDSYFTTFGHHDFLVKQSQKQLRKDNKQKNYNGAWGRSSL